MENRKARKGANGRRKKPSRNYAGRNDEVLLGNLSLALIETNASQQCGVFFVCSGSFSAEPVAVSKVRSVAVAAAQEIRKLTLSQICRPTPANQPIAVVAGPEPERPLRLIM